MVDGVRVSSKGAASETGDGGETGGDGGYSVGSSGFAEAFSLWVGDKAIGLCSIITFSRSISSSEEELLSSASDVRESAMYRIGWDLIHQNGCDIN